MRKILFILCALFLVGSLFAVPTLKVIKTHDYSYVNRIVIVFSSPVKYLYKSNAADSSLQIRIFRTAKDETYVEPNTADSKTIRSIQLVENTPGLVVNIKANMPVRTETMTLNDEGYKLVLDVFQKEPPENYEAGLSIANFYLSTHQFMKAKNIYNKLETTFPDKMEINYYLAKHLAWTKKFKEAVARLEKVPQASREYEFTQTLKNKLTASPDFADFDLDFLDSDYDIALTSPAPTVKKTASDSCVTVPAATQSKHSKRTLLTTLAQAQIPLWLALALMLLLIIINAIMLDMAHRHSPKNRLSDTDYDKPKEPTLFADEESKRKMISKLSQDGWNNREIAKELHISEREVESVVKQLSFSDNA